jgi:hypothetical protein
MQHKLQLIMSQKIIYIYIEFMKNLKNSIGSNL